MTRNSWWRGPVKAEPNFGNLLKVLRREKPDRPTLFEFFMNDPLFRVVTATTGPGPGPTETAYDILRFRMQAFRNLGYDYVTLGVPGFEFPRGRQARQQTLSQNEGVMITDRKSFDSSAWPDPDKADYAMLDTLGRELPAGMKMVVSGPCGVLENVTFLLGYENLCYLIADDERLAGNVFAAVGSRLLKYYQRVLQHDGVGAIIGNDDWGFKSQPMLSPKDMRRLVFPWHKQIVAAAHQAGKPAILHSCGNLASVFDDIVEDIRYDGKHSYEDTILPVEKAYAQYGKRIAILGGIDLDFICRSSSDEVYTRSRAMLEQSAAGGGYGLGTGNSVPEYVPQENYFAMIAAAIDARR